MGGPGSGRGRPRSPIPLSERRKIYKETARLKRQASRPAPWLKKWERKMALCAEALRAAEAHGLCAIPLTQGKVAIVDPEHYEHLMAYQWIARRSIDGKFYAVRRVSGGKYPYVSLGMHRAITSAPDGMDVDHANGDTLDNRACNLRIATRSQNLGNRVEKRPPLAGFKGVRVCNGYFRAACAQVSLGCFRTAEEAARAYDDAARKRWGEFATVNFPKPGERCCLPNKPPESGFLKGAGVSKTVNKLDTCAVSDAEATR